MTDKSASTAARKRRTYKPLLESDIVKHRLSELETDRPWNGGSPQTTEDYVTLTNREHRFLLQELVRKQEAIEALVQSVDVRDRALSQYMNDVNSLKAIIANPNVYIAE